MASKFIGDGSQLTSVNASLFGGQPPSYYQGSSVTIASTAPSNPSEGDLWWDDVDGFLNIYYSSEWTEASPQEDIVTGSGSGLDADRVDGLEASQFVRTDASSTISGNNKITFGPNTTWGKYLNVGGNGHSSDATHASICTTNGNVHIDPISGAFGTYLNWYNGTGGVMFGNGAGTQVGKVDVSGNAVFSGDVTAYSDERLKSDIATFADALETVSQLRGVKYTKDGKASTGVIAQEVERVIPEVVHTEDDEMGTKSVAYGNMMGVMIEAIKELKTIVEEQSSEIAKLKGDK